MQCPRCQHENPFGSNFCLSCGTRLGLRCVSCGSDLPAGSQFCNKCGHAVALQADSDRRSPSPDAYTPKHLAERILTSKAALEGERKQVTVLFADLKGSMELLADRDPEEARRLLDPVLERMMEAVHHYEGTVNQVMGDGIMALFGAPVAHEDHAVRACYAALRMQRRVNLYADEIRREGGTPVQIRVGLHSGEVVVRSIGSDLQMDYTAVGQTTHLAARLEQVAKPGSVLATADTLRLAEGFVQVTDVGPIPIKGLAKPVEVFELVGAGLTRTRWQAAATRGLTRFVGRQREMDALTQALEQARAGHGQIVAPVGEAGVGKSRLFWEFTHSHRTHGWLIHETGSAPYGKGTPYFPIINLLKTYFEIEPRDDARKIHEKVLGKLLTIDRALDPTVPAFLTLLDVPVEDPAWRGLDPAQRRQRTIEAIKRLLFHESQAQPLLIVVEDLHWIDTETQAVLDSLVETLPTTRILLLFNYRPEYQHGWGSKTYYTQLRIDPLPPESAEELLRALLGNDRGLDPLKQLLIDRTEGNPFFLEESVRTLVETKALVSERGGYRLAKDLPSVQVPATVQAVLAARIDRLPPEEKWLLQSASVIGRDAPLVLLQAIAELPEDALRRGLADLQAAEFLYEKSLFPELEYTFKHALTHDVAYGSLLQDRRRRLHGQIVETIERLYPDRLAEQVERLAQHAFRGEVWDKALAYLRQAGAKAAGRSAHREAVTCFDQALTVLRYLPENRATREQAIDLRIDLRNSLFTLGELERSLECLREAEALAETLGDQRRIGRVSTYVAHSSWWVGDHLRAIKSGQRALAIANELGDFALGAETNYRISQAYYSLGDYGRAKDLLRKNVASLEGDLLYERFGLPGFLSVYSRTCLVWCLAELGEFEEGILRGEEEVRIAEAVNQPFSLIHACFGIGYLHVRKGDLVKAITVLERGLAVCHASYIPFFFPWVAAPLGYAYALSGRVADGISFLEQTVKHPVSMALLAFSHSIWAGWLAEAYLLADRMDGAIASAGRALEFARDHNERGHEAHALRLLGEIAWHRDRPKVEEARHHYLQAMTLAEELGMRPLVAHCHLGLGKLYRRTGDRAKAHEYLTTAATMYREMGMTFWLEKAEAASLEG
jgi:class 3 adenylate cyclase/tetratricopeptide (TPR) repeat protein